MKEHLKNFIIIIFIATIFMIPLLQNQYHVGHDTKFHVANVLALAEQMEKGLIHSPILAHIANNFGYGTRLFYPTLPHTVTAGITILLDPVSSRVATSFQIVHCLTILLSAITMYYCAYKFSKKPSHALYSSILYISMPYFLSNIYRRCALAESFVFIFIPIIFSGIFALLEKNTRKFYPLFIIGYVGALLSHFTIMLYFTILLAIFLFFYRKQTLTKEFIKPFILATIAVIFIVSPFIEPMITHKLFGDYVVFQKGTMYKRIISTALTPFDYLNPYPVLKANDTKYHLLLITTFLLIGTCWFRKKIIFPKYSKGIIWFGFIAFWASSVAFPWMMMPSFFKMIQFPWRFVVFVSFAISLIAPLVLTTFNRPKLVKFFFLIITTFSAYQTISFSSDEYIDENNIWWNGGMGWQREYLPVNMNQNLNYYYKRGEDILIQNEATATITVLSNKVPTFIFEVNHLNQETIIELPRIFYFGYHLSLNGKKIDLYENSKGFIETTIKENGTYYLTYKGTILQKWTKILSNLTIITLIFLQLYSICSKKLEKK